MATVISINALRDLVPIMHERPEWVEAMRARLLSREVLQRPQRISRLAEKVDKYVDSTIGRMENIETRLDGHDARLDRVDSSFQELRDDMAPHKAAHAKNAAVEDAITIAYKRPSHPTNSTGAS